MDILKDIIVLDDFIPDIVVDEFYNFISNNVSWTYQSNISGVKGPTDEMLQAYSGFVCNGWHPLSNIILSYVLNEVGLPSSPIVHRMRICMSQKTYTKVNTVSPMHVDIDIPHITIVYYANDNDGETVIYDKIIQNFNDIDQLNPPAILHRVKSKKGRAAIFNGMYLHSGSLSSDADRFFLNMNISY